MATTAVVILAYNNEQFLEKFLPSLIRFTSPVVDLWVVDNASTDATEETIKRDFRSIKYLRFDKNWGFAGGYNKAINEIHSENLVLLNSDVEVTEGWLEPLLSKLEEDGVGAVQPKVKSYHRKTHFEYAGASGGFLDILGYPYCRGRIFDTLEKDESQYDNDQEVFWATGACLAIKRKHFLASGAFDDDFFAHMEEIDMCWRIQMNGLKNFCIPSSHVYHVGGGTLQEGSPRKTFLNFRNSLLMLFKNLPTVAVLPIIFLRLLLDGVVAMKYLIGGEGKLFTAVLKSHFSFYALIPRYLTKRKKIQRNRVQRAPFSIVWQYFVLRNKTYNQIK